MPQRQRRRVSVSRRGFSLAEALIAMAIGSLLLMGPAAFCLPCSVIFCARANSWPWRTSCGSACMPWENISSAPGTAGERAAEPGWS